MSIPENCAENIHTLSDNRGDAAAREDVGFSVSSGLFHGRDNAGARGHYWLSSLCPQGWELLLGNSEVPPEEMKGC